MADRIQKTLLITLEGPLITSSSSATAAAAPALPYIPGAMLQGMALSKAYGDMKPGEVFARFHERLLTFDDALPLDEAGKIGFPVPMSLARPKGEELIFTGGNSNVRDSAMADPEPGDQQCRDFAIGRGGTPVPVRTGTTLRTAIDPNSGMAAEFRLFEYRFLEKGQRFLSRIEGCRKDVEALEGFLNGAHILGRARSAEFGRVRIEVLDAVPNCPESNAEPGTRYFWCLSDCWFDDEHGLPSMAPNARMPGRGVIDWSRSFIRRRRYSGFNSTWGARTPERDVVTRGSVFTICNSNLPTGIHRMGFATEQGLGRILVTAAPPLEVICSEALPICATQAENNQAKEPVGETDLSKWLVARAERLAAAECAPPVCAVKKLYDNARTLNGKPAGPALSQWSSVQVAARDQDISALKKILGVPGSEEALISWRTRFAAGNDGNFSAWMHGKFPGILSETASPVRDGQLAALSALARDVRRAMDREDWLGQEKEGADE